MHDIQIVMCHAFRADVAEFLNVMQMKCNANEI